MPKRSTPQEPDAKPALAAPKGGKPAGAKPSARGVALELLSEVLEKKRPLDELLDGNRGLAALEPRDRAFAYLMMATVLRRLGQIDALIAHALARPLPPRRQRRRTSCASALPSSSSSRSRPMPPWARRSISPRHELGRLQRPHQRGAAPARGRGRGAHRGPGRRAPQHAGLALAELEPGLWRGGGARHCRGLSQGAPTRPHGQGQRGRLGRRARGRAPADRNAAPADGRRRDERCLASPRGPGGCRTRPRHCRHAARRCRGKTRPRSLRGTRRQDGAAGACRRQGDGASSAPPIACGGSRKISRGSVSVPSSSPRTSSCGGPRSRRTPSSSTRPARPPER